MNQDILYAMNNLTKFKYTLLQYEEKWQLNLFKWIMNGSVYLDIEWDLLENKTHRYFQLHMALEDGWFGEPLSP